MALSPSDVRNKRFTPVRLREGYDMGEVDAFLDDVEAELERLLADNEALRAQPNGDGPSGVRPTGSGPSSPPARQSDRSKQPRGEGEDVAASEVSSASEASNAAARLLEIATRNADELVSEATAQAEHLLATARAEAEQLESATRTKVAELEAAARKRSERVDEETAERRSRLLAELAREREGLEDKVAELRAFERECRSRLKAYFESQLAALDEVPQDRPAGDSQTPNAPRISAPSESPRASPHG